MHQEERMQRLSGQVAIVTGGATGIGGATARKLAQEGAKVLIADIDMEMARANAQRIRNAGGQAEAFHADVGLHQDIEAMVRRAVDTWGRLDILVSNAFPVLAPGDGSAVDVTEEHWDRWMAILIKAIFLGAKYAVPEMRKQGKGSIVNISSVHGLLAAERMLVYETGKAAVIGATRQMACDFGPDGIRVNAICPGNIVTERILARVWADNPEGRKLFQDQAPLRRDGSPDDIANAVVYLCSEEASFITGHALVVDGGLSIQLQENISVRQAHYAREHPDARLPDVF
jgi:NAD(P)-dependent dehydrogenase (short-subunit alcohol dehydrogenase family)